MPQIGEIRKAKELGYKGNDKRIWAICELCGKERWTFLKNGKPKHSRCKHCALKDRSGMHNHNWKGGRFNTTDGYVRVYAPDHPNTCEDGYILEHRLVLAQKLGRSLKRSEVGHHFNGIKNDNRPENLIAIEAGAHTALIKPYRQRIRELEMLIDKEQGAVGYDFDYSQDGRAK